MNKWETSGGAEVVDRGKEVEVCLYYPRNREANYIIADLCDVRAADNIRIHYDFDRDGWAIEQPQRQVWLCECPIGNHDPSCGDPKWLEVAFIQAWASNKDAEECPEWEG